MNGATNRPVFNDTILPDRRTRWDLFGASFGLECAIVVVLVVIPLLMPQRMDAVRRYVITPMIEMPHISVWKPKPRIIPVKREVARELPKPVPQPIEVPKPKFIDPVVTAPVARRMTARKNSPLPQIEVAKVFDHNPVISTGSSAIPTLQKPRSLVQTGGFGDPEGVPYTGKVRQAPNINVAGSFDLPNGPGQGNGTGGAKGARGIVASDGFGNGVAVGEKNGGNRGAIQQAGFANQAAVPAAQHERRTETASTDKPVEVLYKPRPTYTAEAKAKRIQGEVLLQVVFTSTGTVEVQRVVKGLGYGLDASAEEAARAIRFHPAEHSGQPVNFPAIVHIDFELAY